ncbi:MAG: Uncharacterised protein [Cryomorphaceae bacterium]|nr:MAG: Uncharacterised protein [Cryomorphaceae bacterium]
MYSLMSSRISDSCESNISSDKVLVSCVLPTPVGPRKINEPIGLLGSFSPTLFLRIAFTTFSTASSCPIILALILSVINESFFLSCDAILFTGMPVIIETTSATFSSETVSLCAFNSFSHISLACSS